MEKMTDDGSLEGGSPASPGQGIEKILACVSPSPLSERLVYAASELAEELSCEWHAVYIESTGHNQLMPKQRDQLLHNLQLAEALGAKLFTLKGKSVVDVLTNYARSQEITKIVAGRPLEKRWDHFLRPSVADQLVSKTGDIDLYLVSNQTEFPQPSKKRARIDLGPWFSYLQSAGLVLVASIISALINPFLSSTNLVMVYLLAVVIAAIYLGRGAAVLASILGAVVFDFFFVPIPYTFEPEDTEYLVTFGGLLIVSLVISQLTAKARQQAENARRREEETSALYGLSRDLAVADGLESVTQVLVAHVNRALGCPAAIFMPASNNGTPLKILSNSPDYEPEEEEITFATKSYERQRKVEVQPPALKFKTQFLPLQTPRKIIGSMGVRLEGTGGHLDPKEIWLLKAFTGQAALAIERAQFEEEARRLQLFKATEKLQTALLNSISHDLRTPLVSITGSLSTLLVDEGSLDEKTQRSLVETAYEEAERLNNFVGNILQMTRIQSGAMRVMKEPCDIQDLIGSALERLHRQIEDRDILLDVPDALPLIPADFVLIVQVLVNLIENAIKYSPENSPVEIWVQPSEGQIEFKVLDRGFGIPPGELNRVFQKFYRVDRAYSAPGTGLGLSICKGIVEAHDGHIEAGLRKGGGMVFSFALPVQYPEKMRSQQG